MKALNKRDGVIQARASTAERMKADELMARMHLSSYGQLVRQLIEEKASALGVG